MAALEPGILIDQRYRVVRRIGSGSVGNVYEVEHVEIGARFALKLLAPRLLGIPGVVERFAREARAAASLDNPHIVRVTDFGREGDRPYLVMELLSGRTLGAAVHAGTLKGREVVELCIQVLEGLGAAHASGVIHRDLKPENLFIEERGGRRTAKILDFGLAKVARPQDDLRTAEGTVFGTPRYMSPEQASGEEVDHRADLYAVGVILFELLSGKPPFEGLSASEVLRKHVVDPAPPLRLNAHVRDLDVAGLQKTVAWTLKKRPSARPATAAALRRELEACLEGKGAETSATRPDAEGDRFPRVARRLAAPVAVLRAGIRSRWRWAAALLVGLTAGFFALTSRTPEPKPPAASAKRAPRIETPPPQPRPQRGDSAAAKPAGNGRTDLLLAATVAERGRIEEASNRLARVLKAHPELVTDPELRGLADRWIQQKRSRAVGALIEVLSRLGEDSGAEEMLAHLAQEAFTFPLRRSAYEGLEQLGLEAVLDQKAYLVRELRRNQTDACTIRRWYVQRLAALRDPSTRGILIRELERRGGFLGLERKGTCLARIVRPALRDMSETTSRESSPR